MPSLPLLKALGLNFSPNQLEVEPGSLVEASNIIIRRDNVIESRRGFALYGTAMGTASDRCKQLLTYKNKLIRHYSDRLQFENGLNNSGVTSFFDFNEIVSGSSTTASINEAKAGLRIRGIEGNSNLYFTSSEGIKKISAKSASTFAASNITQAGGLKALDAQAFLNVSLGDQASFLPSDSGVAYKIVWGTKDASNNLILGAPSDPVTILNPLLDLTLKDFSNFLLQMDNAVNAGSTLFSDNNYYSSLALPLDATSVELRDKLILLTTKLDQDLLFANDIGAGTAYQPLNISGVAVSSGVVTVSFSAGTPSNYFISGDSVNLLGFTSNGIAVDNINTNQIVTSLGASTIIFNAKDYSTTNSLGISGTITNIPTVAAQGSGTCTLTSSGHGLKNNQKIAISGSNSVPNINGTYNITYLSKDSFSIDLKQSFTTSNGSADISCANHGYVAGDTVSFSSGSPSDVTVGTTYYVISTGLTANAFRVSTTPNGGAITFTSNGSGFVSKVITSAGNAATWNIIIDGLTNGIIESYTFRDQTTLPIPVEQSIPATNAQLLSVQSYFSSIVSTLQDFISSRGANIMSTTNFAAYLETISATTSATVTLKITIPSIVLQYTSQSNPYFCQIYRTNIATIDGKTTLSDISIIQEYTQIEEKFPSSGEISSGILTVIDTTPESIAGTGANLYTNERSGEGVLQANDVPPFALDINTFKGYTFFSNTSTRQRKKATLLGVEKMIKNFNAANPYKLTFSNGTNTSTYSFVVGVKEITDLVCGASSGLASSGISNYFLLNSANNQTSYYVWYQYGTSEDPKTLPSLSGKTGIQVVVTAGDTKKIVAEKTINAINNVLSDFTAALCVSISSVNASTDIFNSVNHGFTNGTQVSLFSTGNLPTYTDGITSNIKLDGTYYVVNAAANTFQISLTSGGVALNIDSAGSGIIKVIGKSTISGELLISNNEVGESTDASLGTLPITFSISSIVQGVGENSTNKKILLSPNASVGIAVEETAKSLVRVINQNSSDFINAFYISGTDTTPGTILFESKTLDNNEFYIVASNSIIGQSFNPDLSPSTNLITNIQVLDSINYPNIVTFTTANPHNLLNGQQIVITNSNPDPSIPVTSVDGLKTIIWKSTTTFNVDFITPISGMGTTAAFEATETAEISSNDEQPHRINYSKYQQPESVPLTNYIDIGATDKAILRIFPLRDSLFVFKEDGLYRLSGESAPFSVALFDSSCILIAPDSLSVANNQLYGWTTQGISTITEAGVNIISRPIDTEILKKASSQFTNFKSATWGVGYESDNSYTVYTTDATEDTIGTIGFRYSNLTNSWTTVAKTATCGIVNPSDDKLYLGAGDTNYLEKERKEFTRYDYTDRQVDFSVASSGISGNTLTLSSVSGLNPGDVVVQEQTLTVYEFNLLLEKLDDDPGITNKTYLSTLAAQAGDNLRAKLVSLATRLDIDATPGYLSAITSASGSITSAGIGNPAIITTTAPHGIQTGRYVTISGNTASDVNGVFQITTTGASTFTIPVDLLLAGAGGNFVTNDDAFDDLKVCYNIIINRLNSDPILVFGNYRLLDNSTIQESIIISVNRTAKKITLNLSLEYVAGTITIYKAIPCEFTYSPLTLGDPLGLKHLREATVMFANKAFTNATVKMSTDLLPEFIEIPFNGDGNGIFGHQNFGTGFFGGSSNSAPFRTYIPRQCQRCRFINFGFRHRIAREQFAIYGVTLTGEVGQSTRAYR